MFTRTTIEIAEQKLGWLKKLTFIPAHRNVALPSLMEEVREFTVVFLSVKTLNITEINRSQALVSSDFRKRKDLIASNNFGEAGVRTLSK